ncbi:MAG: pentapeptide repeat-containing protein [Pseudomonadota bacterium]
MSQNVNLKMAPHFELLLEENLERFNDLARQGQAPDLKGANLAGLDLRPALLKGLDLSGCYLRNANLKGVDLTGCNLRGASLRGAQVSGTLFPDNIAPQELRLSLEMGTRLRIQDDSKNLKLLLGLMSEVYKMVREKTCGEEIK